MRGRLFPLAPPCFANRVLTNARGIMRCSMPKQNIDGIDRSAFSVAGFGEQDEDNRNYWLSKTPLERLEGVETIRRVLYGYDPACVRIERVLEVVEQE